MSPENLPEKKKLSDITETPLSPRHAEVKEDCQKIGLNHRERKMHPSFIFIDALATRGLDACNSGNRSQQVVIGYGINVSTAARVPECSSMTQQSVLRQSSHASQGSAIRRVGRSDEMLSRAYFSRGYSGPCVMKLCLTGGCS